MKKLKTLLFSESGMAMPLVITIVTAAVSSIAYIIITLLPQLQDEKKKAQDSINYKIFITSLNDYVIHGIREKWCVNNISYSGGVLETDLLLSNDCDSNKKMYEIVTFPGNLERILWDQTTIGTNGDEPEKNTIIGLSKLYNSTDATQPILTDADIEIAQMKLHLSENVLLNMTNEHPLYIITRNIRNCIKSVDITITRDSAFVAADDKQLSVEIKGNINSAKLSCLSSVKDVSSKSYYTFYPRRLHTYSLIKYDDLKTDRPYEFHGPVYVAGDLILPPDTGFDKSKSAIFYNTLTLGVYNEGIVGGEYRAGKIKTNAGADYTFEERGHPYLSKQDSYPNFRGLIGGLRLDASEDKGFYNLFDQDSSSSGDVTKLEQCIRENQVKTKPSTTAGSIIAYKDANVIGTELNLNIGLTKDNLFKPSISAPKELEALPDTPTKKFLVAVTATSGTKEIGDFKIIINSENTYRFSTAPGSPSELIIDYDKYDLKAATLDSAMTILNGVLTKSNYQVLPAGHTLTIASNLPLYETYIDKVNDFKAACEAEATNICTDFEIAATCTDPATCPDYTTKKTAMNNARDALKSKLNEIKGFITSDLARATFSVTNILNSEAKPFTNQMAIKISFSPSWKEIIPLIKSSLPDDMIIEFRPYEYSGGDIKIVLKHDLTLPGTAMKLKRQDNGTSVPFPTVAGWKSAISMGNIIPFEDEPKDLVELDCPDGMSLADWNQDMSASTNFSWNYANTPAGAIIEEGTHDNLGIINFAPPLIPSGIPENGHKNSTTKSVVNKCVVKNTRQYVFGFYVCKELEIEAGRTTPLTMIGTFIVKDLINENLDTPIYWHSVWDAKAAGLIMTELKRGACATLNGKTWNEIIANEAMKAQVKSCSAMDLVTNGPNNFTWTTIDPDIGIVGNNPMTSQKVIRIQRWIIREDTRSDSIR